jgi:hypothetical protein
MAASPLRTSLLIVTALAAAALLLVIALRPSAAPVVRAPASTTAAEQPPLGAAPDESALMGVIDPARVGAAQALAPASSSVAQAAGWTSWQDLGGTLTSAPAAVSWGAGRIDVFARGGNGDVVQNAKDGTGAWTGWATPGELRGITLRSAPSCTLREGYGGVFQFYWDGQRWGRNDLGGDATSAPSIVAWGRGRLSLFVRNSNGTVIHRYWQPGAADWAPPNWEAVGNGAQLFSAPSCTSRDVGIIDCFSLGPTGIVQQLYYDELGGEGRRWTGWTQLQGVASFRGGSAVSPVGTSRNLLDLFVRGLDMRLYQITYTGSWSSAWAAIDNRTLITAPGCARVGRGRLDCFGRFIDAPAQSDAYFSLSPGLQYRYLQRQ